MNKFREGDPIQVKHTDNFGNILWCDANYVIYLKIDSTDYTPHKIENLEGGFAFVSDYQIRHRKINVKEPASEITKVDVGSNSEEIANRSEDESLTKRERIALAAMQSDWNSEEFKLIDKYDGQTNVISYEQYFQKREKIYFKAADAFLKYSSEND